MGLLQSKGRLEGITDGVDFSQLLKNAARSTLDSALDGQANGSSGRSGPVDGVLRASKPLRGPRKAAMVVTGGVAGLTAASAAVSAVRRRQKEL